MSALAKQQQALLAALFEWPPQAASKAMTKHLDPPWERGLMVYQANGHALARRALGATYPVLAQLMGDDSFAALARAFWHDSPPAKGDVTLWGATLAAFLAGNPQLKDDPYLPDVACVEWALHTCGYAADVMPEMSSLQRLMVCDPEHLSLRLAPGCAVIQSDWPVVSIVLAHKQAHPNFDEAARRLSHGVSEAALVWREGLRPRLREAMPMESELINATLWGQNLSQALTRSEGLDFNAWLHGAVASGLLLGVRMVLEVQGEDAHHNDAPVA